MNDWGMSEDAFEKLLDALSDDRDVAEEKFKRIRQKLITFFESNRCCNSEDLADITISRVAKKISEGTEIYTSNILNFFYGVANNVLHESRTPKNLISLDDVQSDKLISEDPHQIMEKQMEESEHERRHKCLDECLERLPQKERDLIARYYEGEGGKKIKNRKELAKELGVSLGALRLKALRIREKLEKWVDECLKNNQNK